MNGFPTTNGRVRSSAIHRTFRSYRINKSIFIKPNLPDLGSETVIFSKIDTYGSVENRTYRAWVDGVWLMQYKLLEMV